MANQFKIKNGLVVEGPSQISGSLNVSTSVLAQSYTGSNAGVSFLGTASWAVSASWAANGLVSGGSYNISASFASSSLSSSWALRAIQANVATSSLFASQSNFATSASWASQSLSSSYLIPTTTVQQITASWALNSLQSNIATSSLFASQSNFATSASWASQSISASYLIPTTAVQQITASWALNALQSTVATSSLFASQSNFATSASFASSSLSSSYLIPTTTVQQITASWALNALQSNVATSSLFAISASFASSSISASYVGFTGKQNNFVPVWNGNQLSATSSIRDSGSVVVIGPVSAGPGDSASELHVYGNITASSFNGWNIEKTSSISNSPTDYVVIQHTTQSLISAYFDYAIRSASNSRAGTVFGTWNESNIEYSEYATMDIGNTSEVVFSLDLVGSNVRMLANTVLTNWNVRVLGRYL